MKKLLLFELFLFISRLVFAQGDCTSLIERKPADKEINISVFQVLVTALVTDTNILSVVTYSDNASYRALSSETLRKTISAYDISSGLTLDNEQANTGACVDAHQELIIITSFLPNGKAKFVIHNMKSI